MGDKCRFKHVKPKGDDKDTGAKKRRRRRKKKKPKGGGGQDSS